MPKMEASDKFQGLCLQSMEGWQLMGDYDQMPRQIRERLSNSAFNICPACVYVIARDMAAQNHCNTPNFHHYSSAIDSMENMLRCEEVQ